MFKKRDEVTEPANENFWCIFAYVSTFAPPHVPDKKWEFWKICALAPRFVIFAGIVPRMWNFSKTFSGSIDWFLIWISINLWTLSKFQFWLYFVLNFGNNLVFFCGKIIFFSFRGSRSMIDPMMKNIFWTRRKWSKQTDAHSKLKFIFVQFWHFSKNGARS